MNSKLHVIVTWLATRNPLTLRALTHPIVFYIKMSAMHADASRLCQTMYFSLCECLSVKCDEGGRWLTGSHNTQFRLIVAYVCAKCDFFSFVSIYFFSVSFCQYHLCAHIVTGRMYRRWWRRRQWQRLRRFFVVHVKDEGWNSEGDRAVRRVYGCVFVVPLKSTSKWNENLWNCKMWNTRNVYLNLHICCCIRCWFLSFAISSYLPVSPAATSYCCRCCYVIFSYYI